MVRHLWDSSRLHIPLVVIRLFYLFDFFVVEFYAWRWFIGYEVEIDRGEAVGGGWESDAEYFGDGGEGLGVYLLS